MKAPVGLLSDRTVLRSKMEGPRPDKFAFGVRIGRVVDECRTAKGCIKKRIHGFVNGQPELSTAKEANVKNMEKSTMEKLKIRFHDETNDLDYVPVGDYYLPDLILNEQFRSVGYWGRRYRQHLLEYHPVRYQTLLLSGKLNSYLFTIDGQMHEQLNLLIQQMANAEGVTEELKATNQMEWVQRMNNIQNRAKEVIFFD